MSAPLDPPSRRGEPAAPDVAAPPALTHLDADGRARMVDVGDKDETDRRARAEGYIAMRPETLAAILANGLAKGDAIAVARVAGILAAKRTAELIPLCHPLPLTDVELSFEPAQDLPGLRVEASVRTRGRTGVEMEALTAVAVSLLTVFDMAKGVDRTLRIAGIAVVDKSGGKSGPWQRA